MTETFDTISADSIEVGDQIIIDGDQIQVDEINYTDDIDEIVLTGYSHDAGDRVTYSVYADDYFDVWGV